MATRTLSAPLKPAEVRGLLDAAGYLKVVIPISLGQLACSSEDGSYDGLNDIADEMVLESGNLSDISYEAVGFLPATEDEPTGIVLVEVNAQVDDMDDDEDDDMDEELQRDEKRGLYPEHEDPAD